jgi:hypothetical protein
MKICSHHELPLIEGYGSAPLYGWRGMGTTYRCQFCKACLWFKDDPKVTTKDEIKYNDRKRVRNIKWKPKG